MTPKELSAYAAQQLQEITNFYSNWKGELPELKMGCEDIVNPKIFIETNLERIKESHKSKEVIAAFVRLKKYRKEIEKL